MIPLSTQYHHLPVENYQQLLDEKVVTLKKLLIPFVHKKSTEISVFASAVQNFRMRAEFGVWHEGDDCFYIMTEKDIDGQSTKVKIVEFPTACVAINTLMPEILARVKANPIFKQKLFQIEFLSTLANDMLVTLIYHKKLDDDWSALAKELSRDLDCHIIGRSRKQKLVLSQDFVVEKLNVLQNQYVYKQLEGGFTQPNAQVCENMLTWACKQADMLENKQDLLELYCGNANFTLPLSRYFRQVLATEISKTSVAAAQWNITENQITNIKIARLSAEEFTEANQGKREFRRLKQADIDLQSYQFSTIFVDPPRAGIDKDTLALLANFEHIIYISCNPETLADNLITLTTTHDVVSTALFDQFPYTHHTESGVVLIKKSI